MLTALCREQVVRTVFGDDMPPKEIYSATFDILRDDPSPAAPQGKKLVFSGLTFTNTGDGLRFLTDNRHMAGGAGAVPTEYINLCQAAFGDLKW